MSYPKSIELDLPSDLTAPRAARRALAALQPSDEAQLVVGELVTNAVAGAFSAQAVVLDLAGLTYFDASGVHLLRHAHDDAYARGSTFTVGGASRIVRTVLEAVDELDLLDDDEYAK